MHVITGKLRENAKQFPSDNGVTFNVRLSEKVKVWDKDQGVEVDQWTNYSASFFCKTEQGKYFQFLQSILSEGSLIVVSGEALHAVTFQKNDGSTGVELRLTRCRLMNGLNPNYQPQQAQQAPQQQQQQYQPKPSPMANNPQNYTQQAPVDDWSDDIPF